MLRLVAGQHGAVVGQLLAHGHHLLAQQGILLLQEGRPHRDLVFLEPPGIAGPLGRLVVLVPSAPVLLILRRAEGAESQVTQAKGRRSGQQLLTDPPLWLLGNARPLRQTSQEVDHPSPSFAVTTAGQPAGLLVARMLVS